MHVEANNGEIRIADEVVGIIANLAAAEVEGVYGMTGSLAGGLAEMIGKKNPSKGVKVQVTDDTVYVDVHINVKYGASIPEVASKVQANVKQSIETMTGLGVEVVNVYVDGIHFPKTNTLESEAEQSDG